MDDKECAYILFKEGVPQKMIASVVKRTEATIVRWKKEGNWDRRRVESVTAKRTAQEDAQELLNYQLDTLKRMKEDFANAESPTLIPKGAIDGIRDLYNITKENQLDFRMYVRFIRELTKYISDNNMGLAQESMQIFDDFLNSKRNQLQ